MFHGCFKEVSRVFQENFYGASRKFQGGFNGVLCGFQRFKGCSRSLMNVSQKVSGCFMEVLRVFQGSFKVDSRKFYGVSSNTEGHTEGPSKVLQGSFKGSLKEVQRVFQENFK